MEDISQENLENLATINLTDYSKHLCNVLFKSILKNTNLPKELKEEIQKEIKEEKTISKTIYGLKQDYEFNIKIAVKPKNFNYPNYFKIIESQKNLIKTIKSLDFEKIGMLFFLFDKKSFQDKWLLTEGYKNIIENPKRGTKKDCNSIFLQKKQIDKILNIQPRTSSKLLKIFNDKNLIKKEIISEHNKRYGYCVNNKLVVKQTKKLTQSEQKKLQKISLTQPGITFNSSTFNNQIFKSYTEDKHSSGKKILGILIYLTLEMKYNTLINQKNYIPVEENKRIEHFIGLLTEKHNLLKKHQNELIKLFNCKYLIIKNNILYINPKFAQNNNSITYFNNDTYKFFLHNEIEDLNFE